MKSWYADILCCPDCGESLNPSRGAWNCNKCEFSTATNDLRPIRPRITSVELPIAQKLPPEDHLKLISTDAPQITYRGPSAIRDSRAFMSIIEELLVPPGRVLDLGCGPRDQEAPIRHLGHQYIGVDYSSQHAHFLADAHSLPFASESFDCILSYAVLEHLYSPFVAIREIERVLVPGGIYVGTVSQGEPFHQSYFHHTVWGFLTLLETTAHLQPLRVWPALDTLRSLSRMGRYSRVIRVLLGVLDTANAKLPILTPRKMQWPTKERQIDAIHRCGSIAFAVIKREENRGKGRGKVSYRT